MKKCMKIRVMLFKNWKLLFENTNQTLPKFLVKVGLKANHLPPQQKPAAPMAETPLLLRAAITALASSFPLS